MESRALAVQQSPAEQALTLLDWVYESAAEDDGYACIAHNVPLWRQTSEDPEHQRLGDFTQYFYRWPQERQRIDGLFTSAFSPNLAQSREVWFSVCAFPARAGVDPDRTSLGWRAQRLAELSLPTRIVSCDIDHAADNWTPEQLTEIDEWVAKRGGAVVRSGSGENRHVYLKLDRPVPREVTERLNLQLAAKFSGDTTKANTSSVLRLPGTFNHKRPEPSAVRLVVLPDPDRPGLDPDELSAELPEPARHSAPPPDGEFVECLYEDGTPYGLAVLKAELSKLAGTWTGRNITIYKTAARLGNLVAGGELGRDCTWSLLLRAALEVGDNPDLDEGTARRGFNDGLKQPCNAPQLTDADRAALRLQLERWHAKRAALNHTEERPLTTPDDESLPGLRNREQWDRINAKAREDIEKALVLGDLDGVRAAVRLTEQYQKRRDYRLGDTVAKEDVAAELGGISEEALTPPTLTSSMADFLDDIDSRDKPTWLIEGLWPSDAYGAIAAQKKAGKTWAAMDLAMSVASGSEWLGRFPCIQGRVIYVVGEGGERNTVRRMRAIAEHKGTDLRELPIRLCFVPVQITKAEDLQLIRNWMDDYEPSLVVIDPFYLSQGGANGTNLAEMGETLRELQVIVTSRRAALLIVHHFKKGSAFGTDQMTGVGLQEWARVIGTANIAEEVGTEDGTRVELDWYFSGSEIAPRSFKSVRRVGSVDQNSIVVPLSYSVEVSGATLANKRVADKSPVSENQQMLIDALAALGAAGPAEVFKWLGEHRKNRKSYPTTDATREALKRLRELDHIAVRQEGSRTEYWVK
ncbi:AAA family ATPase [Streptomyces mirabilis]|uniref:AAA family ATPase n=1 Tax=Streptomyces mirabilis TaxID=68239 RepID=UPI00365A2E9F